jgi:hypothetical protein
MKTLLCFILLMSTSLGLMAEDTQNGWNLMMPGDNKSNPPINSPSPQP